MKRNLDLLGYDGTSLLCCMTLDSVKNLDSVGHHNNQEPEPDDNFRTYKINDRPSRFIVSLNFNNK